MTVTTFDIISRCVQRDLEERGHEVVEVHTSDWSEEYSELASPRIWLKPVYIMACIKENGQEMVLDAVVEAGATMDDDERFASIHRQFEQGYSDM